MGRILMTVGLPFQKHSDTSREAAEDMRAYAKTARYRVFAFIRDNPGVSDKRIQQELEMNPNTERPRRIELERAGLIRPCGIDPSATGRVLFEATGKEYPESATGDYWRSRMRDARAKRPTPEEIDVAVETMRAAWRLMADRFPPEAVKVMRWLAQQGE